MGTFTRGKGIQKVDLFSSGFPAIHYGEVHTRYRTSTSQTVSYVNEDVFNRSTLALPGDVVLATTSEDDESVAKAVAWVGDDSVAVSGDAVVYSHPMETRFVAYYLGCAKFLRDKMKYITGAKVRRISPQSLSKIFIPVPPLSEQKRIADILDTFDALVNDLESGLPAEIEARRKQYEYYRDKLLTFKKLEPTA